MKFTFNLIGRTTSVTSSGDYTIGLATGNEFQFNVQDRKFAPGLEPDFAIWRDAATGLVCLIRRTPYGHLCGYVGVPTGHKVFGIESEHEDILRELNVHGGVTFSGKIESVNFFDDSDDDGTPVDLEFMETSIWFIGFDAAHSTDFSPGFRNIFSFSWFSNLDFPAGGEVSYKSFEFMKQQCTQLAQQLFML